LIREDGSQGPPKTKGGIKLSSTSAQGKESGEKGKKGSIPVTHKNRRGLRCGKRKKKTKKSCCGRGKGDRGMTNWAAGRVEGLDGKKPDRKGPEARY